MQVTPLATIGYLVAALCFIFGIRQLSSPATARNGNRVAAAGMLVALVVTELLLGARNYAFIIPAMLVGAVIGGYSARAVRMTAMPQMVAMFNGMGAGAAMFVGVGDFRDLSQVGDLAATLFWRFGLDPKTEVKDLIDRPYRLADGKPLRKLFG